MTRLHKLLGENSNENPVFWSAIHFDSATGRPLFCRQFDVLDHTVRKVKCSLNVGCLNCCFRPGVFKVFSKWAKFDHVKAPAGKQCQVSADVPWCRLAPCRHFAQGETLFATVFVFIFALSTSKHHRNVLSCEKSIQKHN